VATFILTQQNGVIVVEIAWFPKHFTKKLCLTLSSGKNHLIFYIQFFASLLAFFLSLFIALLEK
jgi:hypothetical protein